MCVTSQPYFFLPFLLLAPPAEFVEATLDAREGAAELALLPFADLTLSSALFCRFALAYWIICKVGSPYLNAILRFLLGWGT